MFLSEIISELIIKEYDYYLLNLILGRFSFKSVFLQIF
jgi:hypothetical protein